jgi:hypothetical protein
MGHSALVAKLIDSLALVRHEKPWATKWSKTGRIPTGSDSYDDLIENAAFLILYGCC